MLANHVVVSLAICAAVAALEGAAAGRGVRAHYQALRMPRLSPPLPLWIGIGIAYYVMCFVVLLRVLHTAPHTAARIAALTLTVVIILYAFGGPGIHAFAFALVVGVISGCYSTLSIAAPMLLWLLSKKPQTAAPRTEKPIATKSVA